VIYTHIITSYLLSLPFNELATIVGGTGKAKTFWEFIREGRDPLTEPVAEVT
jgi:hypothetical protein